MLVTRVGPVTVGRKCCCRGALGKGGESAGRQVRPMDPTPPTVEGKGLQLQWAVCLAPTVHEMVRHTLRKGKVFAGHDVCVLCCERQYRGSGKGVGKRSDL